MEESQIPTNLRLLRVLEEVVRIGLPVTPTEVNDILGMPKPTIHRLFHTLETEGFLQRNIDGRSYGPGRRLRRMAVNTLSSLHIRTARLAILKALADEVGETCNIATPDREAMIYLDRVETKWPLRIQLPIGTAVPFHCTASGKMYLSSLRPSYLNKYLASAHLKQCTPNTIVDQNLLKEEIENVRKRGFSTDNEEFMEDMAAIAVPIHDDQKRVLCTLSIHAPIQRKSVKKLEEHLDQLNLAAGQLLSLLVD